MDINGIWSTDVWSKINGQPNDPKQPGLLKTVMGPMQIAQSVFQTKKLGNEMPIPADTIDIKTGVPTAGITRSFATIKKSLQLFPLHIQDPQLVLAMNQVALGGQSLALAEDMLFFQGQRAKQNSLPSGVEIDDADIRKLDNGLLGVAEEHKQIIEVFPTRIDQGLPYYGVATFSAIQKGIAQFNKDSQGPAYTLILEPSLFGDANIPLTDDGIVTPATAIHALLEKQGGDFVMSAGLPKNTGLLVSLGGLTTTLYVGTEPLIEPNVYEDGKYYFTARESIQFNNVDHRSLIKLDFQTCLPSKDAKV